MNWYWRGPSAEKREREGEGEGSARTRERKGHPMDDMYMERKQGSENGILIITKNQKVKD